MATLQSTIVYLNLRSPQIEEYGILFLYIKKAK